MQYHFSPINISVHTVDPELRCRMLNNRFAGDVLEKIEFLAQAGIEMNGQIVLCKSYNDGSVLKETIEALAGFHPHMKSLSVVPVGLTRFREHLEPLQPFGEKEAREVLAVIETYQEQLCHESGSRFVFASDEWYLLAGRPLPRQEEYEDYPQLENGVGMLRLLEEEIKEELQKQEGDGRTVKGSLATGSLAAPFLETYMR